MLTALVPASQVQGDLFEDRDRERSSRLMRLLDRLNAEMGAGTLRYAAEGYVKRWRTRFERRSPASTTNWRGPPVATAAEPVRWAGPSPPRPPRNPPPGSLPSPQASRPSPATQHPPPHRAHC